MHLINGSLKKSYNILKCKYNYCYKTPLNLLLRKLSGKWGAGCRHQNWRIWGALVGIETGHGAIVTGAIGAIVFGFAGYFGADYIDEN